jgi:hypothetical protein
MAAAPAVMGRAAVQSSRYNSSGDRGTRAGEEVEVTLLTINQSTRRITGSIQHVADISPEEIEAYAPDETFVAEPAAAAPEEAAPAS